MFRNTSFRTVAFAAILVPILSACATKGFVRESISTERASIDASVAQGLSTERSAREAGDAQLRGSVDELRNTTGQMRNDIESLRRDVTSLRNDFNAEITQLKDGLKFSMPVNFNFDDASVREQDKAILDRFAAVVNNYYGGARVTVEGFADPAGAVAYNQQLSKRRADNVRAYLMEKGVPSDALQSVGYGSTRQVVAGAARNQPGAELNRRVVFVIESRPGAIVMDEELATIPPLN